MELRFGLHDPIGKSQIELLSGVRSAQIRTFGWPIGVLLENRDEYRPRPTSDGIEAEISIADRSLSGERSYDYWSASSRGEFYLLQSLFEDMRSNGKIFFNTRMVRVAEALMFAARLYRELGVTEEAKLSVRVSHLGLTNRELSSSSPMRHVFPRTTTADRSETELVEHVGSIEPHLVSHVKQILAPLFMLFDFMEFGDEVYEDIVSRFARGDSS